MKTATSTRCTSNGVTSTIFNADALAVLPSLAADSIDLIFLDPPYNIGKAFGSSRDSWPSMEEYLAWSKRWLQHCIRVLKPSGSLYLMASTQSMPYFDIWLRDKMTILSRIVWHYDSSGVQAKKHFGSLYEPILHCVLDSKKYTFNGSSVAVPAKTGAVRKLIDYRKSPPAPYNPTKVPGNTWYFPRVRYRMPEYENHPAQKPEALLERIIQASSNVGDSVLEPFAGTFTACAVAQRLDRSSIGIEVQPQYAAIGLRRLGHSAAIQHQTQPTPEAEVNSAPADSPLNPSQGTIFDASKRHPYS